MRDSRLESATSGRQRMLDLARAVTPPRFLRQYRERATFRRRVRRLLAWAIVPIVCWSFVLADGGLLSIAVRRVRILQLQRQVAELERRQALLERSVERRESDPRVLERLARERYGMARPGETVYRIVEISDEDARRIGREQRTLAREAERHGEREAEPAGDREAQRRRGRGRRGAADPDDAGHTRR